MSKASPEQLASLQAPEPVKIEAPLEQPTESVTTPTTPVQKIESAQDIKAKDLQNQATEEAQVTQEQEKAINAF
jgi:hypothetical protein